MTDNTIHRRTFLGTATLAPLVAIAGCLGNDDETDDSVEPLPEFLEVENPPDAVYVPTHHETMRMYNPIETGEIAVAPMLSYPHPFWTVAGTGPEATEREEPEESRGVHMMFTVWHPETGVVLPTDEGTQVRITKDGESVGSPRSLWPMISQEMGFHVGDNVTLPEDGTYTVELELSSLSVERTGGLEEVLTDRQHVTFEFTYDNEFREQVVNVEFLDEEFWGARGALEPMDHAHHADGEHDDHHDSHGHDGHSDGHGHDDHHDSDDHNGHGDDHHNDSNEHGDHNGHTDDHHSDGDEHGDHGAIPYSALPEADEYPGRGLVVPGEESVPTDHQDLPRSGDAAIVATLLDADHRLADGGEYLLVSPRTPYNRVPLADMSIHVECTRDGETIDEGPLTQTLDGEVALHYGRSVPPLEPGDTVTITIESPPQVARHQGYETAFLAMDSVELQVPPR